MTKTPAFSFGDDSVASSYDMVLVPILFEPWAVQLVNQFQPWQGRHVLDLATGTGIVARQLAEQVGPSGKVIAADINGQMLNLARARCADAPASVEFIESPAYPLGIPDESVDVVVCQQGYQFFQDRPAATSEMFRVLRRGGNIILTTWRPVVECEFFGKICQALEAIGEPELSSMMRVPFDFMPESDLAASFEGSGFTNIRVTQHRLDLIIDGGVPSAVEAAYSTPIGPKLRLLTTDRQAEFRASLAGMLNMLSKDSGTMGMMASNLLCAEKIV